MKHAAIALALAGAPSPPADAQSVPAGLAVDRIVLVMRHGVRPPTKAPPMPAGVARDAWPTWQTQPGWLTAHGAIAIGLLGGWDGNWFRAQGLLPAAGCPAVAAVRVVADSDQRTIATAESWARAVAPGCALSITHKPQGESDPIFSAIEESVGTFDPAKADAAVALAAGPGGMAAVEASTRPLLARMDAILCGGAAQGCGVGTDPSRIEPASAGRRPKLSGKLDRASTVAQMLLLEYAEGKPMADVGWGRATAADVTAFSVFHAIEFRLLARPLPIAAANLAGIIPIIREGLIGEMRVTMVSSHDTQVANLGGLLDVHWQVPGLAEDDPAPGGGLVIERLHANDGAQYVRVLYRAQTLEQMRAATPLGGGVEPYQAVLPVPGCTARGVVGLCTLAQFEAKLSAGSR